MKSMDRHKRSENSPPAAAATAAEQQPKKHLTKAHSILPRHLDHVEDDYKMGRELGRGKFGVTYICRETKPKGKKYACKSISKKKLVTESEKDDLRREVTIMKRLKGLESVVQLKDVYEDDKNVHLVMEYCKGGELFDKMKSTGRYTEKTAAQIFSSIMRVVYGLHSMGVMHRDLKPENFLLSKRSPLGFIPCFADYAALKAIDFGLSAYINQGTLNQEKVGTAFYVAPEVLKRQGYGEKVDIWSAGVILYILLTGVPPFYGETEKQIFEAILRENGLDTETRPWPSISKKAKALVEKMLTVDPEQRPTAAQVFDDPWLKENGVDGKPIKSELLASMKRFQAMNKFKQLALKVIADIIPREELEEMKAMFYNMDTDENKAIPRVQLQEALAKLGSQLSEQAIEEIVDAADANRDGHIDYDEFMTVMMHFQKEQKADRILEAFNKFDKNKDGAISGEELKEMMEKYKMDEEAIADIDKLISEADTNSDDKISLEEFEEMMRS